MNLLAFDPAAETDVGGRINNEDAVFASGRVAVIADGVGGAAAGEVASQEIVNAFMSLDKSRLDGPLADALREAVRHGNDALRFLAGARPELESMSTTLTAVAITNEGEYMIVSVGDSRAYLYRDNRLEQLTRDDSLVQALLDSGAITSAEARHHPQRSIVLDALDGSNRPETDVLSHPAALGDRLLLCSDGLSDAIDDAAIAEALAIASNRESAQALVAKALEAGARDNISVIVADVVMRADTGAGWLWDSEGEPKTSD